MDNQKLLELAAKAAGIDGYYVEDDDWWGTGIVYTDEWDCNRCWNPLEDDRDALRLVVKLGIHLQFAMDFVAAYAGSVHARQFSERSGIDSNAATRRAIVRAAAEIGRGM